MIYIDMTNFSPNSNWLNRASQLLIDLTNATDKQAFIDGHKAFWGEIKNDLPYANKCWFSEAIDSVSPYTVEHFRPKNAVTRIDSKKMLKKVSTFREEQRRDWNSGTKYRGEGYWWLTFDYTNYRICGSLINSTKSTRFPIKHNSPIAYSNTRNNVEEIILLDPTRQGDSDLLTFDIDGEAKAANTNKTHFDHMRAVVSIEVYGLNIVGQLVGQRITKWKDCAEAISQANKKFAEMEEMINRNDIANYYNRYDDFMYFVDKCIKPAIAPTSAFSAVAKACLNSYNYDWIKDL